MSADKQLKTQIYSKKMINNLLNNFADNYRGERETGKIKGLSTYMVGGRNLCKVKSKKKMKSGKKKKCHFII